MCHVSVIVSMSSFAIDVMAALQSLRTKSRQKFGEVRAWLLCVEQAYIADRELAI